MNRFKLMKQCLLAASVAMAAGLASAQTTNTVVAQFGTAPSAASNSFTVNLVNTGATTEIAGFSFRVSYSPAQANLASVSDNTDQPSARVQYTLGPVKQAADGSAYRDVIASTLKNLTDTSNLVQLNFEKKAGYTAPFQFKVEDRVHTAASIDGLQGPTVENVPHVFDASQVNH